MSTAEKRWTPQWQASLPKTGRARQETVMRKLAEVLRLRFELQLSSQQIAGSCSILRILYDKPLGILKEFLDHDDARRAAEVMSDLWMYGFRECALTGSVALEVQMISRGRTPQRRPLNDLDYIVDEFASIPSALAGGFLVHHVHPEALPGKLLLQLVDPVRVLRIDLFRAFGASMSRANTFCDPLSKLKRVLSIEDLAARYTSHTYGHLREGRAVERKHAESFLRLASLDKFGNVELETAWHDHRQCLAESFVEARKRTKDLLRLNPELLFHEKYSDTVLPCDQCHDYGPFQRDEPALIVNSLGYW